MGSEILWYRSADKMLAEIQKQTTEGAYWVDETDLLKALTTLIQRGAASWENNIAVVLNKTSKAKDKRFEIGRHRNQNYAPACFTDNLLRTVVDSRSP